MRVAIKVQIIESEAGWGTKVDDHMICIDLENANQFIKEFNSKNTSKTVPSWYMYAEGKEEIYCTESQFKALNEHPQKRMFIDEFDKF